MSPEGSAIASALTSFIIDRIDVGVLVINSNHEIIFWNEFMVTHSGKNPDEVLHKNLFEVFPEVPKRWFIKKLDTVLTLQHSAFISWEQRQYLFKLRHSRPITGGDVKYMAQNISLMPMKPVVGADWADGAKGGLVCVSINDATDVYIVQGKLEVANRRLELSSQIDGLTQIYNRAHWERRLAEAFGGCMRYRDTLTLAMLDLDHFKSINDQYGHLAGDEVIKFVAGKISEALRDQDVFGRYGGEEFGVIFANTGMEGALVVAERLRRIILDSDIALPGGESIKVTISVGLAEYDPSMKNHEGLISAADEALYKSKTLGRNRVTQYRTGS